MDYPELYSIISRVISVPNSIPKPKPVDDDENITRHSKLFPIAIPGNTFSSSILEGLHELCLGERTSTNTYNE